MTVDITTEPSRNPPGLVDAVREVPSRDVAAVLDAVEMHYRAILPRDGVAITIRLQPTPVPPER